MFQRNVRSILVLPGAKGQPPEVQNRIWNQPKAKTRDGLSTLALFGVKELAKLPTKNQPEVRNWKWNHQPKAKTKNGLSTLALRGASGQPLEVQNRKWNQPKAKTRNGLSTLALRGVKGLAKLQILNQNLLMALP